MTARLELDGITKGFPGVIANADVSFKVAPGEIHALLGENGAGKSTLVKQIYGALQPDQGSILWEGRETAIADPKAARALGIGMVFQHFSLFEAMTVLENVALGIDARSERRALAQRIREVSRSYGLPLDPSRSVHELSVGERQRIEIVRCLLESPRLLIMDEPTSVLTPQEVERLFETLRQLAAEGCSILYISHKLQEIKALCDTATILRGGRVVAACDPRAETTRSMAQLMIGAELRSVVRRQTARQGKVRLEVRGLSLPAETSHGTSLAGIDLQVHGGEILGIAGVAGNGQNELLQALSGERTALRADAVALDGQPVGHLHAGLRRRHGLCVVPEERNGHGAVPDMSLVENAVLTGHERMALAQGGIVKSDRARAFAGSIVQRFDVRAAGIDSAARSLSGGNLQKFILGREIMQDPAVLVVSQPTWGVDAGAAATIHEALLALAQGGAAILVISQDLDELLALTDRLAVINVGRLSRPLVTATARIEEIGLLMGGLHGQDAAAQAA